MTGKKISRLPQTEVQTPQWDGHFCEADITADTAKRADLFIK